MNEAVTDTATMAERAPDAPILIVDDDDEIREVMRTVLEVEGYSVIEARDGREALETLHRGGPRPQLILLDLMMPVMDGQQFRETQRRDAQLSNIPVVLVSAFAPLDVHAESLGAAGYLQKPFELDTLLDVVARQRANGPPS